MSRPRRKLASLVLLLVLTAGFGAALASAAGAHEMMCCPEGMEAQAAGCTWLGASNCCTDAPAAPTPSSTAPQASAACSALGQPAPGLARAALSFRTLAPPNAQPGLRTTVLRL